MYVIGLVTVYYFSRYASKKGSLKLNVQEIETMMFYGLIGMILGARLVYVLIYNPEHYLLNPAEIFETWKGGLSFHGAIIGICIAISLFASRANKSFLNITDHICTVAPVGIAFGRIGNFINGELWGRVTESSLGMVFPDGGPFPRHPSQLYESIFEGWILLGIMLIFYRARPRTGVISSFFLIFYATFRFFLEFFREPDAQLGAVLGAFSMGQILCAIMWVCGALLLTYTVNVKAPDKASASAI
jgi:phosphatidylglycerol:prolipoprotein diacylglycerol transferase